MPPDPVTPEDWLEQEAKAQLFSFLADGQELLQRDGKAITRAEARTLLQAMIPARVEVRGICRRPIAAVVAAPHVSFDNWSEYFCNRLAREFETGWVVAKNFRDQDTHTIPVAIGRHLHVNRPTESTRPRGVERVTPRSREVYEQYLAALIEAAGRTLLPLDLLLEIHSHHRTPQVEIATTGIDHHFAAEIAGVYAAHQRKNGSLPELKIEPLHKVQLPAERTKHSGSLRPDVTRHALHIEIPREGRQSEEIRRAMCRALFHLATCVFQNLESETKELS